MGLHSEHALAGFICLFPLAAILPVQPLQYLQTERGIEVDVDEEEVTAVGAEAFCFRTYLCTTDRFKNGGRSNLTVSWCAVILAVLCLKTLFQSLLHMNLLLL
jgi:hypothetical protein